MKCMRGLLIAGLSFLISCAPAYASQAGIAAPTSGSPNGLTIVNSYNSALAAIASSQAGGGDPAAYVAAYMWWMDTGNSLLKQRNSSNTAWVTIAPALTRLATQSETQNASNLSSGQVSRTLLPAASTSATGIVQLDSSVSSTSVSTAGTSSAVKSAYDLASSANSAAAAAQATASGIPLPAGTMSANGCWRDPNTGMRVAWGSTSTAVGAGGSLSFPGCAGFSNIFSLTASYQGYGGANGFTWVYYGKSTTGFSWAWNCFQCSTGIGNAVTIEWRAVGN